MKAKKFLASACAFAASFALTQADTDALRADFKNPPVQSRAQTWYHLASSAITKSGITADMEAMRDIGYTTAHVFAIGSMTSVPNTEVKIDSPEWYDLMRHLGSEAKRCGITLGMHNCPGWSSSGGPWIKPEDSMKKVTASETFVKSPAGRVKLPRPETVRNYFCDIAVFAVPSGEPMPSPKVSSNLKDAANVLKSQSVELPTKTQKVGESSSILFEFDKPYFAKNAKIVFNDRHVYMGVDVYVSDDGKKFSKVAGRDISSFYDMQAPKFIPLGAGVSGKFYRFDFRRVKFPSWFSDRNLHVMSVGLSQDVRIENLNEKSGIGKLIRYFAPADKNVRGIEKSSIVNLTDKFDDGEVDASSLPAGNWTILRVGYSSTGAKNGPTSLSGLECDKLSKRGLDAHWPHFMAKMQAAFGGALKNATIDSYEVGGQNWTQDFAAQFKARRGYDITEWLPVLAGYPVGSAEETAKFLFDVETTVSELFAENYYDYFTELCHKNGLKSVLEPYNGSFDNIRMGRSGDFVTGEFWVDKNSQPTRTFASMSNVYGKARAGAESFTTMYDEGRWSQDPRQLKEYGDRAWSRGISAFIMHSYVHQPFNAAPGFSLGKHGSQLNRLNTWWSMGSSWIDYVARGQVLLQRGKFVAEVLCVPSDGNPNSLFYTNRTDDFYRAGYPADACSPTDVSELMSVENGRVRVSENGTDYAVLKIETDCGMKLKTMRALKNLIENGAVACVKKPAYSSSLSDSQKEFDALVSEIWGDGQAVRKLGDGVLYTSGDALEALRKTGIKPSYIARGLSVIRRVDGDTDIFFVCNPSEIKASRTVSFKVGEGKAPQLWNAVSGEIEPIAQWTRRGEYVDIPLEFLEYDSKFIVFDSGAEKSVAKFDSTSAQTASDVKIIEAWFGVQDTPQRKDVRAVIEKNLNSTVIVSNSNFGGDPAPNKPKTLRVVYSANGKTKRAEIREGRDFFVDSESAGRLGIRPVVSDGAFCAAFDVDGKAFGKFSDGASFSAEVSNLPQALDISSLWRVDFQKNRGAPDSILLEKLESLSKHSDDGVRHFSGIATYSKTFSVPEKFFAKNRKIILSFGSVNNVAEVFLNGKKLGTLWTPPFELDITKSVKKGENKLEVRVANLWVNRIIGDQKFPNEGYPKWVLEGKSVSETKRFTWSHWENSWSANSPLFDSGLVGAAEIRPRDIVPLEK